MGQRTELEAERHATADGACGLHQIHGLAILAEDRDVSLRQEIADVDDRFHMAAQAGDWLADKNIQERIGLSWRRVEHVDRRKGRAVYPAVRRDPASVGMGRGSAQLRGEGGAALSRE